MHLPILVVDDEPGIRLVLSGILENAGHQVVTAGDGNAALSIVEHTALSLIVTDLQMPGLDGRGLCQALLARESTVPVVVMTAVNAAAIAQEVGAVGYLDKPFTIYQAWAIIETALQAAAVPPVPIEAVAQERALRVLVLTEQRFLAEMIKLTLNHGVFVAREARDVVTAGAVIRDWQPHLAVVDLDGGGDHLLNHLGSDRPQAATRTPILAVTRRGDLKTKLAAFDWGVDDVMTMPLSPEELLARVVVITRRSSGLYPALKPVMQLGDLEMDILNRTVRIGSSALYLTGLEQSLLYLLAANAGEVLTRDEILDALWGDDYAAESNVVDRHIHTLRAKLHNGSEEHPYIVTVPGQGYRFMARTVELASVS